MSENTPYYLAFSHALGIGPVRLANLMAKYGPIDLCYGLNRGEMAAVVGPHAAEKFIELRKKLDPVKKLEAYRRDGIHVICPEDDLYPGPLRTISDPPICLYIRGHLGSVSFAEHKPVAIVGTRKASDYGCYVAGQFSSVLAQAGCVIVSGMALGIDSIAHEAALEYGGKTVAVLGCGVDIVYPYANKKLYEQIVGGGGWVVSEFSPGMFVRKGFFIARNRLISGLSAGVLVVEGTKDSGALATARYAAEQNRTVYAPPAPLTSQLSQAPNILLKEGAVFVTSPEDILEDLKIKSVKTVPRRLPSDLPEEERLLMVLLLCESLTVDELKAKSGMPLGRVVDTVSSLELKGLVLRGASGKYRVVG